MIFVDTGAWFASIVPSDSDHQNAILWLTNNTQSLVTTDYVIDETLTLLRARGESKRAIILGEAFFSGKLATGQCEVLGKSTSLLGFQPPTSFTPLPDSQSLKGFQCKAFRHFVKMSDRELRTLQF